MIRSFGDKNTERLFDREFVPRFPTEIVRAALQMLEILNAAQRLNELRSPPGNQLKKLSGDRNGQHSIRINKQWRICFRWQEGDAYDVEIVDYHG